MPVRYKNGQEFHGDFLFKEYWYDDSKAPVWSETPYKNGKVNGDILQYFYGFDYKICFMASYKENILHGFRKEYFANGTLASCKYFVNGVQQSMDLSFFATGKLSVSSSVANNMLHGLTRIFDEVGYLCHEEMWRNGDKAKKCPLENFI